MTEIRNFQGDRIMHVVVDDVPSLDLNPIRQRAAGYTYSLALADRLALLAEVDRLQGEASAMREALGDITAVIHALGDVATP